MKLRNARKCDIVKHRPYLGLLGAVVISFILGISCANQAKSDDYEIAGTLNLMDGAAASFGTGIIKSTGKIINNTGMASLLPNSTMTIESGTTSENADQSTGTFHNHGILVLYEGSQIRGTGQILNYAGFAEDTDNTSKASSNHTNQENGTNESQQESITGYKIEGNISDYDAARFLNTKEELAHAAYFDLVNDDYKRDTNNEIAKTNEFKIYSGAEIYSTDACPCNCDADDNSCHHVSNGDSHIEGVTISIAEDNFDQTQTALNEGYNLASANKYSKDYLGKGFETELKSSAPDEVKGSFYSIEGYTQYADRKEMEVYKDNTTNGENQNSSTNAESGYDVDAEDFEKGTKFKFNLTSVTDEGSQVTYQSYTPVYVPAVDTDLVISKTIDPSNTALIENYKTDVMATLEDESGKRKIPGEDGPAFTSWNEDTDPVTTYSGDNSWFNGVYKLKKGGAIIPSTGSIFGGRIELGDPTIVPKPELLVRSESHEYYETVDDFQRDIDIENSDALDVAKRVYPTELEWQGGAKDEYNKPEIVMNGNSTIYFNIPADANGKKIFSAYGSIKSTPYDRLIFEQGEVRIKGDWSGFQGQIGLCQGAEFKVTSSDAASSSTYTGKFPNANIYQLDADGHLVRSVSEKTEVDTANMENVIINNGRMKLTNTLTKTGESADGIKKTVITLDTAKVTNSAITELDGDAAIKDTTIQGIVEANGDLTAVETTIEGGILVLKGNLTTNNLTVGSTIVAWGNNNYGDRVSIADGGTDTNTFTISSDHTLKFYGDYNLETKDTNISGATVYQSDRINATSANNVESGDGMRIGGMNFKGTPTEDEYKFLVYSGPDTTDIKLELGADYGATTVFKAYADGSFTTTTDGLTEIGDVYGNNANDIKYSYSTAKNELTTATVNHTENGVTFTKTIDFGGGNVYYVGTQSKKDSVISASRYNGYVILRKVAGTSAVSVDAAHETAIMDSPVTIGDIVTDFDSLFDSEFDATVGATSFADDNSGFIKTEWSSDGNFGGFVDGYADNGVNMDRTGNNGNGVSIDLNDDQNKNSGNNASFESDNSFYQENRTLGIAKARRNYALYTRKETGRFKIWDKTFGEINKQDMKGSSSDLKTTSYGTIIGFDGDPIQLSRFNAKFMPTIFAGLQKNHLKYNGTKYQADGYFGGLKAALYNGKNAIELFGFYEFIKTHANITSGKVNIKSHAISLGAKYGYNFEIKPNWFLRPNIFFDYAYATTPSFKTGNNTSKHKINDQHRFDVAPGLSLTNRIALWINKIFVSYHQKFGTKGKTTVNNQTSNIDLSKKNHIEYGVEVKRTNAKGNADFGLKITRKGFGVRGFKATISLGLKF